MSSLDVAITDIRTSTTSKSLEDHGPSNVPKVAYDYSEIYSH